jgi:hypothetical protein
MKCFQWLFLGLSTLSLSSCFKDKCKETYRYTDYEPIYRSIEQIRQPIQSQAARTLQQPGKMFWYGQYLFVSEREAGIHVIDLSNPAQPQTRSFIPVPGNVDIAVKNGVLYADNYIDLVSIDITDPLNVRLLDRDENVFPSFGTDPQLGIVVGYREVERVYEGDCNGGGGGIWLQDMAGGGSVASGVQNSSAGGVRATVSGVAGSMARFAAHGDHLYVLNNTDLLVFSLNNAQNPQQVASTTVGFAIETIFPQDDYLFIGSQNGMFIYSVSNPTQPTYVSEFRHANACDPVYVQGTVAFITLRDGTPCQNATNELNVVDISQIQNPQLISRFSMHNPHGLSVQDRYLYLCDGSQGLKVFDITNLNTIDQQQVFQDANLSTYDVIAAPNSNLLLVIGSNGLYLYDRSNPAQPQRLGHIPVSPL